MIRLVILGLLGVTGLAIGADQLAPSGGQDIISSFQLDKVVGAGGLFTLLFMTVKYLLNKNEAQSAKIEQLHAEKEAILKDDHAAMLNVLDDVRDALKEIGKRNA